MSVIFKTVVYLYIQQLSYNLYVCVGNSMIN